MDLSEPLTRARFEELNNDLFKKTLTPVRKVICPFGPFPPVASTNTAVIKPAWWLNKVART